MYAGWDWGSERHEITVINDAGEIVDSFSAKHDEAGFAEALARLGTWRQPHELPIAIKATYGLVVDRLIAAGHSVVPIHPGAFHAALPRWGASSAKSDRGDSYKLADYLRTDGHRLRRLHVLDAATAELRVLVRTRDDHVNAKIAAINQLFSLLEDHWPGSRTLSFSASTAPSHWPFSATIRPRTALRARVRAAWPGSWHVMATAVTARHVNWCSVCVPLPSRRQSLVVRRSPR